MVENNKFFERICNILSKLAETSLLRIRLLLIRIQLFTVMLKMMRIRSRIRIRNIHIRLLVGIFCADYAIHFRLKYKIK